MGCNEQSGLRRQLKKVAKGLKVKSPDICLDFFDIMEKLAYAIYNTIN